MNVFQTKAFPPKYRRAFQICYDMALQNPDQYKFCSVALNKKGHIISMSFQQATKSHPLQYKYAKKAGLIEKIYLHSEICTLLKANNPYILIVLRVDSKGNLVNSKPCPICYLAIKNTPSLKSVYFGQDNQIHSLDFNPSTTPS